MALGQIVSNVTLVQITADCLAYTSQYRLGLVEAFVEDDRIFGYQAFFAQAQMTDAPALTHGEVARDIIIGDFVKIGAGAEGYAPPGAVLTAVVDNVIMMNLYIIIIRILMQEFILLLYCKPGMSHPNTAAKEAGVIHNPIIADD